MKELKEYSTLFNTLNLRLFVKCGLSNELDCSEDHMVNI